VFFLFPSPYKEGKVRYFEKKHPQDDKASFVFEGIGFRTQPKDRIS